MLDNSAISSEAPASILGYVRFCAEERAVFREAEDLTPSEWAEKYRVLPEGGHRPGPWSNEYAPHLVGPMDTFGEPWVREIILCSAPQGGKTEVALNCLGWAIEREPTTAMYVMPTQDKGDLAATRRIKTMISLCPPLASQALRSKTSHFRFLKSEIIMATGGSPSSISAEAARVIVVDEFDKMPEQSGKETSPRHLVKERKRSFLDEWKMVVISTPNDLGGNMDQEMAEADELRRYHVRCPECGKLQLMTHHRIQWPDDVHDGPEIERRKLARYACEGCPALWDDAARSDAVGLGEWIADKPVERPRIVAFHLPAWCVPWVSLSEVAAAYLAAKRGGIAEKKRWATQFKAVPWKTVESIGSDADILLARCALPAQTVPMEAVALTCGVDMQADGFWYVVRAWAKDFTSWLIHYGHLGAWEDLEEFLFKVSYPYQDRPDLRLPLWRVAMDTGGGVYDTGKSMTETAYLWLDKNRRGRGVPIWPTKGASGSQSMLIQPGKPLRLTPSGKPLRGGMRLLFLDTARWKEAVHFRLRAAAAGEPEAAWLHAETGADYSRQIMAEQMVRDVKKGLIWKQISHNNHLLDCEVSAMAAASTGWPGGGVNLIRHPLENQTAEASPRPKPAVARSKFMGG